MKFRKPISIFKCCQRVVNMSNENTIKKFEKKNKKNGDFDILYYFNF